MGPDGDSVYDFLGTLFQSMERLRWQRQGLPGDCYGGSERGVIGDNDRHYRQGGGMSAFWFSIAVLSFSIASGGATSEYAKTGESWQLILALFNFGGAAFAMFLLIHTLDEKKDV